MKRILAVILTPLVAMAAAFAVPSAASGETPPRPAAVYSHNVCGPPAAGTAACHAKVVDVDAGTHGRPPTPQVSTAPAGFSPAQIRTAYGYPGGSGEGQGKTIAIVDAYNSPSAESDLGVFSSQFGLPACTTSNGCFKKVSQTGSTKYPTANAGWALEIALDVQWAHAMAPAAKILLVEASSNSFTNLMAAVDYAKTHAQYVSMSWGSSEFSGETSYDPHFVQSGVSFFVSAGDNGTPAEYPSSSPNVLSIGGTTLTLNVDGTTASEIGWTDGGGGCSLYEGKNGNQTVTSLCAMRATPDISLVADPATGMAVYDTTTYNGRSGWFVVGGTSASAPMIAGRSAATGTAVTASTIYSSAFTARDIVDGNNGEPCLTGYDLCTGVGAWSSVPLSGGGGTTEPPPAQASTYQITSPSGTTGYAVARRGHDLLVTVTLVDNLGARVSGASVTISLSLDGSPIRTGTGTTGSTGSVQFKYANAPSGTYSTTVTGVTGTTLTQDGGTPANSFFKG